MEKRTLIIIEVIEVIAIVVLAYLLYREMRPTEEPL